MEEGRSRGRVGSREEPVRSLAVSSRPGYNAWLHEKFTVADEFTVVALGHSSGSGGERGALSVAGASRRG